MLLTNKEIVIIETILTPINSYIFFKYFSKYFQSRKVKLSEKDLVKKAKEAAFQEAYNYGRTYGFPGTQPKKRWKRK